MPDDLRRLMRVYSRRGLRDWTKAANGLRAVARCLAGAIADTEWEVDRAINGRPGELKFIPMPKHGYKGFKWCFFLPARGEGDELRSLILFILVTSANGVAFRFESGRGRGRHEYSHIQMTSNLKKSGLPNGTAGEIRCLPDWLPASYPAFPVPAENWMEMFLVMATAVHGGRGGIDVLIRDLLLEEDPKAESYRRVMGNWMRILDRNRL